MRLKKQEKLHVFFSVIELILPLILLSSLISVNAASNDGQILSAYQLPASQSQQSRVETFTMSAPQLGGRQKNIQVYLPPGYDTGSIAYPVFYLHDGEYHFDPPREGYGDYQIDETLDRLTATDVIEGAIVVGIEHDYDHQWSEYSPWVNENMYDWIKPQNSAPVEGGEGFAFIDFIAKTLKPEIDSRYRTLPGRENTAIGGFCRGALIPLVAGLDYSDVFSMAISMSPTVWFAESGGRWLSNNRLIAHIKEIDVPKDVKFFINVGTEESSGDRPATRDQNGKRITYPQAYLEGAEAVYTALISNGVPESNVYFEIIQGSAGGRDIWGERFNVAVQWLFSKEVVEEIQPTEKPITETEGEPISTPEMEDEPLSTPETENDPLITPETEDDPLPTAEKEGIHIVTIPTSETETGGIFKSNIKWILITGGCAGVLLMAVILLFVLHQLKKK